MKKLYLKKYLTNEKKKIIKNKINGNNKVSIYMLSAIVKEPLCVVYDFVKEIKDYKTHALAKDYLDYSKTNYIWIPDYNIYLHQYIISKELGVSVEVIKEYEVHHIVKEEKHNNDRDNLYLALREVHRTSHDKFYSIRDLNEKTEAYIEEKLKTINESLEVNTDDIKAVELIKQKKHIEVYLELYEKQKKLHLEDAIIEN